MSIVSAANVASKQAVRMMCAAAVVEAKLTGKYIVCEPKRRYDRGHNRTATPAVRPVR